MLRTMPSCASEWLKQLASLAAGFVEVRRPCMVLRRTPYFRSGSWRKIFECASDSSVFHVFAQFFVPNWFDDVVVIAGAFGKQTVLIVTPPRNGDHDYALAAR